MLRKPFLVLVLGAIGVAAVVACSSNEEATPDDGLSEDDPPRPPRQPPAPDPEPTPDDDAGVEPPPPPAPNIYAHTSKALFLFNPETKALTKIGDFDCLGGELMVDLAVTATGEVYGTSFNSLFTINPQTASCTAVKNDAGFPNGLSFVPAGTLDPSAEVLVGYAAQVTYIRIDRTTGATTVVGSLNATDSGTQWEISGDIVAIASENNRAFATVESSLSPNASLAEVDPKTGTIKTILGTTGHPHIFGLAYWKGKLYGFDDGQHILEISMTTGAATDVTPTGVDAGLTVWYGAGVTTLAPKQ